MNCVPFDTATMAPELLRIAINLAAFGISTSNFPEVPTVGSENGLVHIHPLAISEPPFSSWY